jgi:2-oxoglutarate ferredoxin oxidoreductase subunit beta
MTPPPSATADSPAPHYTSKDFQSDQVVRWCPGCGDYAILNAVQHTMAKIGLPKEDIVFISGIGCSSRFPYYMNTYGFHTIHGRAPGFASGLKVANPRLSVWVITGDGDALSIGGNHLIHALRRNIDVKILLFNNRIYGLTKGQYSPTSEVGKVTKSSPMGSLDRPLSPISVALAAEASFVARSVDVQAPHLQSMLLEAANHKGSAFIEIMQNCNVFNHGTWQNVTERSVRADQQLVLEDDKPMRFGAENNKGLRLNGLTPEVVTIGENGVTEDDLWVHNADDPEGMGAYILSRLGYPEYPTPIGIFRRMNLPTYDGQVHQQVDDAKAKSTPDLAALVRGSVNWTVAGDGSITGG